LEVDFATLWQVAGPIFIGAIVAVVIGSFAWSIKSMIPSRLGKQLFGVLSVVLVVVGVWWSIDIAQAYGQESSGVALMSGFLFWS
jgi:hypothetical protein